MSENYNKKELNRLHGVKSKVISKINQLDSQLAKLNKQRNDLYDELASADRNYQQMKKKVQGSKYFNPGSSNYLKRG